jgi:hypothetical protein
MELRAWPRGRLALSAAVFYSNAAVERTSRFQARFLGCDFAISAIVDGAYSVFLSQAFSMGDDFAQVRRNAFLLPRRLMCS